MGVVLGLCAFALVTTPAFPNSSIAQEKSLKDQLGGTWIYVSSTGKRDDGSAVPRPSLRRVVHWRDGETCTHTNATIVETDASVGSADTRRARPPGRADEASVASRLKVALNIPHLSVVSCARLTCDANKYLARGSLATRGYNRRIPISGADKCSALALMTFGPSWR
jgi:hypothetical protein